MRIKDKTHETHADHQVAVTIKVDVVHPEVEVSDHVNMVEVELEDLVITTIAVEAVRTLQETETAHGIIETKADVAITGGRFTIIGIEISTEIIAIIGNSRLEITENIHLVKTESILLATIENSHHATGTTHHVIIVTLTEIVTTITGIVISTEIIVNVVIILPVTAIIIVRRYAQIDQIIDHLVRTKQAEDEARVRIFR